LFAYGRRASAYRTAVGGYRRLLRDFHQHAGAVTASGDAAVWLARLAAQARSLLADLQALLPADLEVQVPPTLAELAAIMDERPKTEDESSSDVKESFNFQDAEPLSFVLRPSTLLACHDTIAATAQVAAMDFTFLYDDRRRVRDRPGARPDDAGALE